MTATEDTEAEAPKKKSKMPLILGLVLAIVGAGGGFMAVQMGLIGGSAEVAEDHADVYSEDHETAEIVPASFVPLNTIIVNLPNQSGYDLLRFTAQVEVAPQYQAEVEGITPRIVDVLNSYLRAVDIEDLEDPTALARLRSQMLRRVQVVTGQNRVSDLLIMEFVLN